MTLTILAPDGCLQYYQGVTGTLISFNYIEATGTFKNNSSSKFHLREVHPHRIATK